MSNYDNTHEGFDRTVINDQGSRNNDNFDSTGGGYDVPGTKGAIDSTSEYKSHTANMNTGRGLERSGQDFSSNQGPGSFERARSGGFADSQKMDKFNDYGTSFTGGGTGSGPTGMSTGRDDDNEFASTGRGRNMPGESSSNFGNQKQGFGNQEFGGSGEQNRGGNDESLSRQTRDLYEDIKNSGSGGGNLRSTGPTSQGRDSNY